MMKTNSTSGKVSFLLRTFFIHPWSLIVRHWGVVLVSAGVVATDRFLNGTGWVAASHGINEIIFIDFPYYVSLVFNHTAILVAIVALFAVKSLFIVYFAYDLSLQFMQTRVSVIHSMRSLCGRAVISFFILECVVYAAFGGVALLFFQCAKAAWTAGIPYAAAIVIVPFVVLYPLFYISLSLSAFASILPQPVIKSLVVLLEFLRPRNFRKSYLFYLVRSFVDYSCLFVIPALVLFMTKNWLVSTVLISISLAIPIALVRASSFAFKLHILSENLYIYALFSEYFVLSLRVKQIESGGL